MAKGTNHIAAGMVLGLCCLFVVRTYCTSPFDSLIWFLLAVSGSLFPDIDIKSKGQKLFYSCMVPFYVFLFVQKQLYLCFFVGLTSVVPFFCCHRGLFHKWWFIMVFVAFWAFTILQIYPSYSVKIFIGALFFMIGSLSHLWLDFGVQRMFRC